MNSWVCQSSCMTLGVFLKCQTFTINAIWNSFVNFSIFNSRAFLGFASSCLQSLFIAYLSLAYFLKNEPSKSNSCATRGWRSVVQFYFREGRFPSIWSDERCSQVYIWSFNWSSLHDTWSSFRYKAFQYKITIIFIRIGKAFMTNSAFMTKWIVIIFRSPQDFRKWYRVTHTGACTQQKNK